MPPQQPSLCEGLGPGPLVQHLPVWVKSRLGWPYTQSLWQQQPTGFPCLGKGKAQGEGGNAGLREILWEAAQLTAPFLEKSPSLLLA